MDKVTSSVNLLEEVLQLQNQTRPKVAAVWDSKALSIPMFLGWKQDDDQEAVDLDLEDLDFHLQLAAVSQQSTFHNYPILKKSNLLSKQKKQSATETQTISSERMQILQWLYSHKNSPYNQIIPLHLWPSIIQEFSTDTDESCFCFIMMFIDNEIEALEQP